jgi:subtilisin family serine protease
VKRLLLVAAVVAAVLPAQGHSARYAVGAQPGVRLDGLAARLAAVSNGRVSDERRALRVLTVHGSSRGLRRVRGVAWVERLGRARRVSFTASDPLARLQWYLAATHAFDSWVAPPALPAVRVAVVDSGLDLQHPEFAGRVVASRSFVGGTAADELGHGTFVAGIVAADVENDEGIAGVGLSARLLIAKVVRHDGSIPIDGEADAIRWAADHGARVINLSLGGVRDPLDASRDTYSPLEAAAVAYAQRRGALVVAAVGNGGDAPSMPWPYANYPAALPHVLGVGAVGRTGDVPEFSNRDKALVDLGAPGEDIVSTLPYSVTAEQGTCADQGYSLCGPRDYRSGRGTSFSAPQATAAAALLLSLRPRLTAAQLSWALTRNADDMSSATGCDACRVGRDALSGWGRLDIAASVDAVGSTRVPAADLLEPNDDAGSSAGTVWGRAKRSLRASLDYWDDSRDVYRLYVRGGRAVRATLSGPAGVRLALWRPGTDRLALSSARQRVAQSTRRGAVERLAYVVPRGRGGWYYLQAWLGRPGAGPYTLALGAR